MPLNRLFSNRLKPIVGSKTIKIRECEGSKCSPENRKSGPECSGSSRRLRPSLAPQEKESEGGESLPDFFSYLEK